MEEQEINLYGKTVVITGATGGIGSAIAFEFAKAGANIAICYNNATLTAEEYKSQIEQLGRKAECYQLDVSDEKSVKKVMKAIYNEFGQIDILINNAGVSVSKYIIKTAESVFDKIMGTNFKGTFLCMKTAAKYMMKNGGEIINIASMLGSYPDANDGVYAASKAAVITLSQAAALELESSNIRVNVINPGMVETNMTKKSYSDEKKAAYIGTIPVRRLATGKDIANTAVMIASSTYINGQVFNIDGGLV